jgi:hypothetical protein
MSLVHHVLGVLGYAFLGVTGVGAILVLWVALVDE